MTLPDWRTNGEPNGDELLGVFAGRSAFRRSVLRLDTSRRVALALELVDVLI
jgi:hypothetical protein